MRLQLIGNDNSTVYCDWRITVSNCQDGDWFKTLYTVLAVFSGVALAFVSLLLTTRFWSRRLMRVGMRLRMIERISIMGFLSVLFFFAHSLLVVNDTYTSAVPANIMFGLGYVFSYVGVMVVADASYQFILKERLSMASTLKDIFNPKLRAVIVSFMCIYYLIMIVVVNAIIGYWDDMDEPQKEQYAYVICQSLQAIHIIFTVLFLAAGNYKLVTIMNRKLMQTDSPSILKVEILQIKIVAILLPAALSVFIFTNGFMAWCYTLYSNLLLSRAIAVIHLISPTTCILFLAAVLLFMQLRSIKEHAQSSSDQKSSFTNSKTARAVGTLEATTKQKTEYESYISMLPPAAMSIIGVDEQAIDQFLASRQLIRD